MANRFEFKPKGMLSKKGEIDAAAYHNGEVLFENNFVTSYDDCFIKTDVQLFQKRLNPSKRCTDSFYKVTGKPLDISTGTI